VWLLVCLQQNGSTAAVPAGVGAMVGFRPCCRIQQLAAAHYRCTNMWAAGTSIFPCHSAQRLPLNSQCPSPPPPPTHT
jgi:hypothetical protein